MYSVNFTKSAERKVKKLTVEDREKLALVVKKLAVNPFDLSLKTHKLNGEFDGLYSCRLDYSDRVLFVIIELDKTITIVDIGSHDEVY
jgi:addiction module RelE/StbE family toxin